MSFMFTILNMEKKRPKELTDNKIKGNPTFI